jgi:hypothetical protein
VRGEQAEGIGGEKIELAGRARLRDRRRMVDVRLEPVVARTLDCAEQRRAVLGAPGPLLRRV